MERSRRFRVGVDSEPFNSWRGRTAQGHGRNDQENMAPFVTTLISLPR
jgi:hypothetical protein